jgi:hypothetical protein
MLKHIIFVSVGFLQELVFQSHKQLIEIQQTGRRTQKNVKLDVSQTKPEVRQTVIPFLKIYCTKGSASPEVELRFTDFCPRLPLFKI